MPLRLSELRHTAALDPASDHLIPLTLRGRATTQHPRVHYETKHLIAAVALTENPSSYLTT